MKCLECKQEFKTGEYGVQVTLFYEDDKKGSRPLEKQYVHARHFREGTSQSAPVITDDYGFDIYSDRKN